MLPTPQPFRSPSIPTIHPQCTYLRTMWRLGIGTDSPRPCHFTTSRKLWSIPVGIPSNYFQDRCLILSVLPLISTKPRLVPLAHISNYGSKRQPQHLFLLLMPTNLVFTRNVPLETTIVFETTGHPFYEVEIENNTFRRPSSCASLTSLCRTSTFSFKMDGTE